MSQTSCLEFCQGSWIESDTGLAPRLSHTSWRTEDGVYLMGGGGSNGMTTTFVRDDGTVSEGFDLEIFTL